MYTVHGIILYWILASEANRVKKLALGQQVNYDKSSIFFSKNTSQADREMVDQVLVTHEWAKEDSKYLGLPSTMNRDS